MALLFFTEQPADLLQSFEKRIRQKEAKGKIKTWMEAEEPKHFRHTSDQWRDSALLKSAISERKKYLIFRVLEAKGAAYGSVQGDLLQTFIEHFGKEFTAARFLDLRKKKR